MFKAVPSVDSNTFEFRAGMPAPRKQLLESHLAKSLAAGAFIQQVFLEEGAYIMTDCTYQKQRLHISKAPIALKNSLGCSKTWELKAPVSFITQIQQILSISLFTTCLQLLTSSLLI